MKVTIEEATKRLPELVNRAASGEEIIIERDGTAVAQLVPPVIKRKPGRLRGRIRIGPDFDDPL